MNCFALFVFQDLVGRGIGGHDDDMATASSAARGQDLYGRGAGPASSAKRQNLLSKAVTDSPGRMPFDPDQQ